MPRYDFSQCLKERDGSDAKKGDKPFTFQLAFEEALLAEYSPDGRPPTPSVRTARFKMWRKLTRAEPGVLEITVDEANTLKDAAAAFQTLTYGQLLELLDGPGVPPPAAKSPIQDAVAEALPDRPAK